jgi:hypothetical protein
MRLEIRHRTLYKFGAPMRWITQSHRLTPSVCAGQRTLDWRIQVEGGEIGASFTDGAGDTVSTMTIPGPVEALEVVVEGVVETVDTAGLLRDHREVISPRVYLTSTTATKPSLPLAELAAAATAAGDAGELAVAHRLAEAVSDAIAFTPGATHAGGNRRCFPAQCRVLPRHHPGVVALAAPHRIQRITG